MFLKYGFSLLFSFMCGQAFAQEKVDLDFYKGYFDDASIIVLHNSRPARPGDLIRFFGDDQNYRVHSLELCANNSLIKEKLNQKSTQGIKTTSESKDWFESIEISGNILGLGGSYKSTISRKDTIIFSGENQKSNFRAYSENLTVGLFDLHNVIDVDRCPYYIEWAQAKDGLVIPESVFWFEGELQVKSLVELNLEKKVSLNASALSDLVTMVPWASAILNSVEVGAGAIDKVSKETQMLDNFPKLENNEIPTAIAIRPLYINPEIAEEISRLFTLYTEKTGARPSRNDAKAFLIENPSLQLQSKASLLNTVFLPSETVFRQWLAESEKNIEVALDVRRIIYLNYFAFGNDG